MSWELWALLIVGLGLTALAAQRFLRRTVLRFHDRFDLAELSRRLDVPVETLRGFEPRYRSHHVRKRGTSRDAGTRKLDVPRPETMAMQRRVAKRLLRRLPVHPAASAWERGCSPARNAATHQGKGVVIKLDIVEFFASTSADRVSAYFRRIGWDEDAAAVLTRITTHDGALPQGAPTSPLLANRLAFPIDRAIAIWVAYRQGTYTRYGDDLTISFAKDYPKRIRGVIQHVGRVLKKHGYQMHRQRKLRVLRRHQKQLVTGCVVNDGARLPRQKRRWLRAVEHRLKTTGRATLRDDQLRGWRGWESSVDAARRGPSTSSD